jgi:hypothetical protein
VAWRRRWPIAGVALVTFAAVGSHVVLDWLGHDSSPPFGVMALWPFRHDYFISGLDVFADVSRRYWKPDEFILGNAMSIAREVLVLGPLAAVAFRARPGRQAGKSTGGRRS